MRKTIAILFGGCSSEYEVSLQSAAAVLDAVDRKKYEVLKIGITRDGTWLEYEGGTDEIRDDGWASHPSCTPAMISADRKDHGVMVWKEGRPELVYVDAVFPVLHGRNGEDGSVQGLCALAGIPVVGCGILSSALCMDKHRAHLLAETAGIEVPEGQVFGRKECASGELGRLKEAAERLGLSEGRAVFVKPVKAGSSFGITRVERAEELEEAVREALRQDQEVLVEESVDGFEVGCAILGTEQLTVGKVDEIELSGGLFDFTEKYHLLTSKIHMPARITEETAGRVREAAVRIYRVLGCSGFARVDLFLKPDGSLVFNEVNTIPGFTSHSRYPNMMKGVGRSFGDVVNTLIGLAEPS